MGIDGYYSKLNEQQQGNANENINILEPREPLFKSHIAHEYVKMGRYSEAQLWRLNETNRVFPEVPHGLRVHGT